MGNQNKYGDILKRMRVAAGFNCEQLGVAIGRSGQTIRNWENGLYPPDVESWDKIKNVCSEKTKAA